VVLFTVTGKHVRITDAIKEHAEQKTAKLPRCYDSISQVEVIIDGSRKGSIEVEIIARAEHGKVFVAGERGADAYRCIDLAVHRLQSQLRRIKAKERDKKQAGGTEIG
jgi:putative sigma-54 modulation protein